MRKRAKISKMWCSKRSKLTQLNAQNKIEKELDIVRFIKQQKYLKIMISLLFTRQERYLMSKNKRLTISHAAVEDSSDNID